MDVGRDVKIGKKYLFGLEIFRGSKHLYFENVNSSDLSFSVLFFNFFLMYCVSQEQMSVVYLVNCRQK